MNSVINRLIIGDENNPKNWKMCLKSFSCLEEGLDGFFLGGLV